jgi:hypothetical protein
MEQMLDVPLAAPINADADRSMASAAPSAPATMTTRVVPSQRIEPRLIQTAGRTSYRGRWMTHSGLEPGRTGFHYGSGLISEPTLDQLIHFDNQRADALQDHRSEPASPTTFVSMLTANLYKRSVLELMGSPFLMDRTAEDREELERCTIPELAKFLGLEIRKRISVLSDVLRAVGLHSYRIADSGVFDQGFERELLSDIIGPSPFRSSIASAIYRDMLNHVGAGGHIGGAWGQLERDGDGLVMALSPIERRTRDRTPAEIIE